MLEVGLEDRQADPEQLNQDVHLVILSRLNWKKKQIELIFGRKLRSYKSKVSELLVNYACTKEHFNRNPNQINQIQNENTLYTK